MKNSKNKKRRKKLISSKKAQTFPIVLIMSAIVSFMGLAMVKLLNYEVKLMTKSACVMEKEELSSVALEHALFKLQHGSNWDMLPLKKFNGYDHEFSSSLGFYALHIAKGNLFMSGGIRQGQTEFRTIGIKVRAHKQGTTQECTGRYYAVIKRVNFGGPIVSKGKVDFPCTDNTIGEFESYWGDIYCGNTILGYCRIPKVPVGAGNHSPQDWKPHVYSKADIYTAVGSSGGGRTADIYFGSTYTDMSPTAHCHPFSPFADVPEMDLDYYKRLAYNNNAYYGPPNIPGVGVNPYYIDSDHETNDVVVLDGDGQNTKIDTLFNHMTSIDPPSVLFIDTTDGLPLRKSPCNSYAITGSGTRHLDVQSDDGTDGTLRWYKDEFNERFSKGLLFIQGPLMIVGNDPNSDGDSSPDLADSDSVRTGTPDNFYFPRRESDENFYFNSSNTYNSYIGNVKHEGLIYVGGELQFGGKGFSCSSRESCSNTNVTSKINIYGSIYIGELGSITTWAPTFLTDNETHIYYNPSINVFGFTGSRVTVLSFNEISFLIPTPNPSYPDSF